MSQRKEQRRGLGRGLSALMADVSQNESNENVETPRRPDRLIPIEQIIPNPDQPRRNFTPEQLEELAASIKTKGVIQPLIVRPKPESDNLYEIVAGERRWRASQMAKLHELPVIVRDFNDTEVLEVAIIENIQRADLNPIEEARAYRQLMFKFGHTQEKMAEALGKSRSYIANLLRLLNLSEDIQTMVEGGDLSAGHARALITATNPDEIAKQVVSKGLSVRETERLAKGRVISANPAKPRDPAGFSFDKDADTKALESDLGAALGMKVVITHSPGQESGKLSIAYENLEQLDALCALLSTYR